MMKIVGSFILSGILIHSATGWAQTLTKEQLLEQPTRPTLKQIQALSSSDSYGFPAKNSIPVIQEAPMPDAQYNFDLWLNGAVLRESPRMIAEFEKAFPGATLAFIGRDMALIADIFEAYYTSIGQPERVVRIDVSSKTFEHITADQMVAYLKQKGAENSNKPFILVDTISKGNGRQGRALLQAWYRYQQGQGVKISDEIRRVNMIGLEISATDPQIAKNSLSNVREILQAEQQAYETDPNRSITDHKILIFKDKRPMGTHLGINEVGYEQWTGSWHEPFGEVYVDGGELKTRVGGLRAPTMRQAVIAFQTQILRQMTTPSFHQRVQEALREGSDSTARIVAEPKKIEKKSMWGRVMSCVRGVGGK